MSKLVAILGACVVVAGGAGYAAYNYGVFGEEKACLGSCPVAVSGGCCAPAAFDEPTDVSAAMAVAGPVAALTATSPVSAEVAGCCAAKTVAVASCCEAAPSDTGLVALAGAAITTK